MGQLVRDTDWSKTPLGAFEDWPQSLRSSLSLVLNSKGIAALYWGPQQWLLYNDAYGEALGDRHPLAFGKSMPEVLSDIGPVLGPQVAEVLRTGHGFAIENFSIMMHRHGRNEKTTWTYSFSPVQGEDGSFAGVLLLATEMTVQRKLEAQLRQQHVQFRQLFDQSPAFMALLTGPEHTFQVTNAPYQQAIEHRDVIGKPVAEALPDAAAQGFIDLLDNVFRTGEAYVAANAKFNVQVSPGSPVIERYLDFSYQPMKSDDGTTYGIFVNGLDVTERKMADRLRDVLHNEMVHRVKNIMAIVSAVVTASLRNASSVEDVRETISARIQALGRTQDLLTRATGETDLRSLVLEAMQPHVDSPDRMTVQGPLLTLSPQQAVGLSLAIYELATNAIKYGALSVPEGTVTIDWSNDASGAFEFHWREQGGPVVAEPTRTGFGSKLTNRIVATYFSGSGQTRFYANGVEYVLKGSTRVDATAPEIAVE